MSWRGLFHPFITFLVGINVGLAAVELGRMFYRHPRVWG